MTDEKHYLTALSYSLEVLEFVFSVMHDLLQDFSNLLKFSLCSVHKQMSAKASSSEGKSLTVLTLSTCHFQ